MIIQGINVASIMTYLINEVAYTMEHDWDAEFNHKYLTGYFENVQDKMRKINYNKLTEEEFNFLGFRKISDDNMNYLIPRWLLRCLPAGTEVMSMIGEKRIVGRDSIDGNISSFYIVCSYLEIVEC